MMWLSLLPVLLLAPAAASTLTYTETDPRTGARLQCDGCPPGTYLRARCTSERPSECAPCPAGSFTELWNYIGRCLRCRVCGHNQVERRACRADRDGQCGCKEGLFYQRRFDLCLHHSECPAGQGALRHGTTDEDTVCHICPNGTFSDVVSARRNCTEHRSCVAPGLQLLLKGSVWHDSVCMSCGEHKARDGADYLREILPAFFLHQNLPQRRLHYVVNRLPSSDGKRRSRISGLHQAELHTRLDTWIGSATAGQIRRLLAILRNAGASISSKRLQNKLQKIDSQLSEQCILGNKVDM